ncbi:Peptide deformylase [Sesbania bispinosa]|nr:Peptide deformylase [Sesbania bispinosa]
MGGLEWKQVCEDVNNNESVDIRRESEKKGHGGLAVATCASHICCPKHSFPRQTATTRIIWSCNARPPLGLGLSLASSQNGTATARAGWFLGLTDNKKMKLRDTVKAGDPVLHEPAQEVDPIEIRSERVQKIIDDMIRVMRNAPGNNVGQLKIIVLEDTKEYISYVPKEETKAQDRRPFDLLVIVNPKLEKKSNSVDGFRAVVERYLDVEVTGLDRDGVPIKITASGWQARILQHECDHLDGTLYVDKMVPRTFRTVDNMDLPLAQGCPKLGPR